MPSGLYSGPLKRGVKAKSARTRPSMVGKSAYYRRLKKRPARLNSGTTSYYRSRSQASKLKSFGETKIQSLRPVDLQQPVLMNPIGAGIAPVWGLRYVIGDTIPTYGSYNALGGMTWQRGPNADQRIGNYMYFRRVNLTMEINMNQVGQTNSGPRRFRLIIFKARRYANPTGLTANPNTALMLKAEGTTFGVESIGPPQPNMLDFTHLLANKRDFTIVKDQTFILQNPVGNPSGSVDPFIPTSGQYKGTKVIKCNLPLWRKTIFNNESNQPINLNYNYGVYLQALNVGSNTAVPDDWTLSIRGTVSANDV